MDYNFCKNVLNGEVECSAEEYDVAVADATKCIDLLLEVAKIANDPCSMSCFAIEKIRTKLNLELQGSKERYISQERW